MASCVSPVSEPCMYVTGDGSVGPNVISVMNAPQSTRVASGAAATPTTWAFRAVPTVRASLIVPSALYQARYVYMPLVEVVPGTQLNANWPGSSGQFLGVESSQM